MARPEKVKVVEELAQKLTDAGSVFVTDYAGLTVIDITDLRAQLRAAGISYRVAKNTLLRLAAKQAGVQELIGSFQGPTAVAFGDRDPVAGAKIFKDFYTRLEHPEVRSFVVEGHMYGSEDLKAFAALPPREDVLAGLVAAVESPITGFVGTLNAVIRDFIGTIDALAKKREDEGQA
jgi:large subunit ribosomal protein L10